MSLQGPGTEATAHLTHLLLIMCPQCTPTYTQARLSTAKKQGRPIPCVDFVCDVYSVLETPYKYHAISIKTRNWPIQQEKRVPSTPFPLPLPLLLQLRQPESSCLPCSDQHYDHCGGQEGAGCRHNVAHMHASTQSEQGAQVGGPVGR